MRTHYHKSKPVSYRTAAVRANPRTRKGVNAQEATMRACARVASNYSFAKSMEIAESVPTGPVRQATKFFKRQATKFLIFYNFTRAL